MLFVPRQLINRKIAELTAGIANAGNRKVTSAWPTVDERFKRNSPQRHPRNEDGFGRIIRLGIDPALCINRGRPQNSFPQQPSPFTRQIRFAHSGNNAQP